MPELEEHEKYLNMLIADIEAAKANGKKSVYWINYKIQNSTASYLVNHFKGNPDYNIESKKCPHCTHTWDIIISWR